MFSLRAINTKTANTAITYHALQRAKKRAGFNANASAKLIENAIIFGKGAECFRGREHDYLHSRTCNGKIALVYNSFCFIINEEDNCCITMHSVPAWFGKTHYDGKREIRDTKKYMRFYRYFELEDVEYGIC